MDERKTILVVDDVFANVEILVGLLRPSYKVIMALDGPKALKLAECDAPPDLILLDIMMPGMDGYEVCRKLKENPQTEGIPVIFVTARNQDYDEARGFNLGAVDFITKPIRPLVVTARVKTHITLAAAKRELEKQNALLQENLHLREEMDRVTHHDLKGPLTAILNIPALLARDENLTPDQRDLLRMISLSGHRMRTMIGNTLDLVRMERGTYELRPVPVEICGLIRQTLRDLDTLRADRNLSVVVTVQNVPWSDGCEFRVDGEDTLLYSMLANLIKNALEASPSGGTVSISLTRDQRIVLAIANQGAIPDPIRATFFFRYATFGKKGGTGLGAYSALLMARTLGGDLTVTTSDQDGTKIEILLPLEGEASTGGAPQGTTEKPVVREKKPRNRMRVLVADDYSYMRCVETDVLRSMGFCLLTEAEDGNKASSYLETEEFDLILSDWEMPGVSGIDLVKKVRATRWGKEVPFLIITGNDLADMVRAAATAGVSGYLAKPFSGDMLREKIQSLLAGSEIRA